MNHQNDWNEEEDNFNLALSQRTEELYRIPNLEPDENGLIEASVLPLRDLVIFPRMVSPIFVGREASLLAVQEAQAKTLNVIGLVQKDPEVEDPKPADFLPDRNRDGRRSTALHAGRFIVCPGARPAAGGDR